jgi:allantoinase
VWRREGQVVTDRRAGMDHDLYEYSALPSRRPYSWPNGARIALRVVVYLDYWELASPAESVQAPDVQGPWPVIPPDYRTHSYREYGSRVGIFRLLDLLEELNIRATLAVGAAACERYAFVVKLCQSRGWELAAHGTHATRMVTSMMSEDDEKLVIQEAITAIEAVSGVSPRGWIAQDYGESVRTPHLVAEAGLEYIGDWPNDEQPYFMTAGGGRLVSLPAQPEWDDVELLWIRQLPTTKYPTVVNDAFRRLYADAEHGARMLTLALHPWLIAQPHRFPYLKEAIARIACEPGVWAATSTEVAQAFAEVAPTAGAGASE